MAQKYFNPFVELNFSKNICFLTGKETDGVLTVFPEWILEKYGFADEEFTMMDKVEKVMYKDFTIPCSPEVKEVFDRLDEEVQAAWTENYEGMKALDSVRLFQWIGRMVYGMLYHELNFERNRFEKYNKDFGLSDVLKERYGIFHLMLQSILYPMKFEGVKPWTLLILRQRQTDDVFSFRDDAINLVFSMRVKGFGIIAHLQDNDAILTKEKELIDKIGETDLHPIQFEELYGRFHYSDYIKLYKPEYGFMQTEDELIINGIPVEPEEGFPLYGFWDEDMFAQVLGNYWDNYGLQKHDILIMTEPIKSFLLNPYTKDFIHPDTINLLY